jgi:hypothetical protein
VNVYRGLKAAGLMPLLIMAFLPLAISAGSIALARPQIEHSVVKQVPAIDVFISADVSEDMDDPSVYGDPNSMPEFTLSVITPGFFVDHMQDARIALSTFTMRTFLYYPFSTDKHVLQIEAKTIADSKQSSEWQTYDSPDGPIMTSIDMFTKYSKAKTKVFVLITDADADTYVTNEANLAMAESLKRLGVHMYLIVTGSDGPYDPNTDLVRFVESLGANGHLIHATSPDEMNKAVADINSYERTPVSVESEPVLTDVYFPFVIAAGVFFGLSLLVKLLIGQFL